MEGNIVRFKSMTSMGDLVASMCGIKTYCEENNKKAIIYQSLDIMNVPYTTVVHHIKDEAGNMVCMNEPIFNFIKPLIISQNYIEDYVIYSGQEIDMDLDIVRYGVFSNLPKGAIQNWDGLWFDELQGDISQKWVDVPIIGKNNLIALNFTQRYRNQYINYFFLKQYEKYLIFLGTENECDLFSRRWRVNVKYVTIKDALELAQILNTVRFTLCNQSMIWNLCQAMQIPRLLEICAEFPNCIHGVGKNSYGYYRQESLERLFKKLFDK